MLKAAERRGGPFRFIARVAFSRSLHGVALKSRWDGSSNRISNGFDITQREDDALVLP